MLIHSFQRGLQKGANVHIYSWSVVQGYRWAPLGFSPAFSLTLLRPLNGPTLHSVSGVSNALTHTFGHAHLYTHKQEVCLHTKSILHSSKKMKAILIIQSTFAHARTHAKAQKKTERLREQLFYAFPLRQRRQSVWRIESLCVRERGNEKWRRGRERVHCLPALMCECVCLCVCVHEYLRACRLPSITPPLYPQATLCHSHTLRRLSRHWARRPKTFLWHCVCHGGDRAEMGFAQTHTLAAMFPSIKGTLYGLNSLFL